MSLTFGELKPGDIFRWADYSEGICMKIRKCAYIDEDAVGDVREMFIYITHCDVGDVGELYAQHPDREVVLVRVEDLRK